jgi:hypothetical protein
MREMIGLDRFLTDFRPISGPKSIFQKQIRFKTVNYKLKASEIRVVLLQG